MCRRPTLGAMSYWTRLLLLACLLSTSLGFVLVQHPRRLPGGPLFAKGFAAKGAGATTAAPLKDKPWVSTEKKDAEAEATFAALLEKSRDIRDYLSPSVTPEVLADARRRLREGDVVVIKNAFNPVFAELTHREIRAPSAPWQHNEKYFPDGYAFCHSNIWDHSVWSARMNATFSVFESDATKAWIEDLTGRSADGECTGSPSLYRAGDHSLPHTDWAGQRTVAYVWHLSKDWLPEYGGALYWCQHHYDRAFYPASFNTLVLFSVSTTSSHFVTTVSPNAGSAKRLTFNGWWQSGWVPRGTDDESLLEGRLDTKEKRAALTHTQLQAVRDMITDKWSRLPPERKQRVKELSDLCMSELFSPKEKE